MDAKGRFRRQMEAELIDWEAELEHWRRREEHVVGDAQRRREQQQILEDLHEQRLKARHYLDELDRGGDWTVLQSEMEQLWAEIRRSITAIKAEA